MSKVAIITDSTAYIPKDLVSKYNIHVAPQILLWGEEEFEDGVDIQPSEFYARLRNTKVMPSTSQVTPKTFHAMYSRLTEAEQDVLAILISEKLSGTIASAVQAKEMFPTAAIEIVDSRTTAMALGFQVLTVARAAAEGANLAECKALAEEALTHVGVVFAVDTLEFLHRGGRIGGATRFLGTAIQLKPVLEVTGGRVEAVEKVRTRKKSLARVVELVGEQIGGRTPVRIASLHADAKEEAEELLVQAISQFHPVESIFSEVSPVVGTHAGPGTLGLAFMAGM